MIPQLHVDLETLDTRRTAMILSIGAVFQEAEFYIEIDRASYLSSDPYTYSEKTLDWWEQQGGFSYTQEPESYSAAVHKFAQWVRELTDEASEWEIWANAPSFDCEILKYHFEQLMIPPPWQFYQERDVRTIKNLYQFLKLPIRGYKNPHHALKDAKNQRDMVQSVYMTLADHLQKYRKCMESMPSGMAVGRETESNA